MLELDKIVPIDSRSSGLLTLGDGASGKESSGFGLDLEERIILLEQRLVATRDPELAREILQGATSAMKKAGDPKAQYSFREALGLEAVVETVDRPSLNIQDGFVNPAAAGYKPFGFKLLKMQDEIRDVIAAVGCINMAGGVLAGTAIHFAESYVATARHVLEEIAAQADDGTWSLISPDETTIDFLGEAGRKSEPQFRVVGVKFCGDDPINRQINFAHLDLAVLEIAPITDAPWPSSVTLGGNDRALKREAWVYTVGFPGRPKPWKANSTPAPGYEIASVIAETFADDFDCKKFAPGRVLLSPGMLADDHARRWVFAHDCSTLRGNSGSAVVEFAAEGTRVLGLHFGGFARSANWAHAFSALQEPMKEQGATYV